MFKAFLALIFIGPVAVFIIGGTIIDSFVRDHTHKRVTDADHAWVLNQMAKDEPMAPIVQKAPDFTQAQLDEAFAKLKEDGISDEEAHKGERDLAGAIAATKAVDDFNNYMQAKADAIDAG